MKHRVTTPDGATIEFVPAGPARRFLAGFADALIVIAAAGAIDRFLTALLPRGVSFAASALIGVFGSIVYGAVADLRFDGRTVGKRWQNLRVVDAQGRILSLPQSLIRNVARAADFLPAFYGLGAASMLADPMRRRLGDRLAGTLVVDERQVAPPSAQPSKYLSETTLRRDEIRRKARALSSDERDLLWALFEREGTLSGQPRFEVFEAAALHFRERLQLPAIESLSGENFVRSIASALAEPSTRSPRLKTSR